MAAQRRPADPLRRRHRRAARADGRGRGRRGRRRLAGPAGRGDAAGSARRTRCRATSTRPCSGARGRCSPSGSARSIRSGAAAPGHVFNLGHGVPPDDRPGRAGPDRRARARRGPDAAVRPRTAVTPRSGRAVSSAVVVGGGISGLAAARGWREAGLAVDRARGRPAAGAASSPGPVGDLGLDAGAESVLARRPEAVGLVDDLGLGDRLVHPTDATPRLLRRRAAAPAAAVAAGRAGRPVDALRPLLTPDGAAYAADRARPCRPRRSTGDVAIGAYVDERFGPEVTDRLLEPLLGGVYAGRARGAVLRGGRPGAVRARPGRAGRWSAHAAALARPPAAGPGVRRAGRRRARAGRRPGRRPRPRAGSMLRRGDHRDRADRGRRRLATRGRPVRRRRRCGRRRGARPVPAAARPPPAARRGRRLGGRPTWPPSRTRRSPWSRWCVRGARADRLRAAGPARRAADRQGADLLQPKWAWVAEARPGRAGATDVAVVRASVGPGSARSALLQLDDADAGRPHRSREPGDRCPAGRGADAGRPRRVTPLGRRRCRSTRVGHRGPGRPAAGRGGRRAGRSRCAGAYLDGVGIAACLASADGRGTRCWPTSGGADGDRPPTASAPQERHGSEGAGDQRHHPLHDVVGVPADAAPLDDRPTQVADGAAPPSSAASRDASTSTTTTS